MNVQVLSKLSKNAMYAIIAAVSIVALSFVSFVLAEPQISHSQDDSAVFTVQQTITGEATFLVDPSNVTMVGNISGVTGGNATGSTQFSVQSSSGYYIEIDFGAAANTYVGQYAMYGNTSDSEAIYDYRYGNAEPGFGYTPEANASFAYTVAATTSTHIDPSFQHNNTDTCNTGSNTTEGLCWATPSSSAFRIIDSGSTPALTAASSTITFKVNVPAGATPLPTADTYTATATLSLYSQ